MALYNAVTFSTYEAALKRLPEFDVWAKHGAAGIVAGLARVRRRFQIGFFETFVFILDHYNISN